MSTIAEIEKRVGALPAAYRRWIEEGVPEDPRFHVGEFLEWFPPTMGMEAHTRSDVGWGERGVEGLWPLGSCNQAALWCLDNQRGQRVILFEGAKAELYAPTVEGWLLRIALDLASGFDEDEAESVRGTMLNLSSLLERTQRAWATRLRTLAREPVLAVEGKSYVALVPPERVERVVEAELGSNYLDGEVEYLAAVDTSGG